MNESRWGAFEDICIVGDEGLKVIKKRAELNGYVKDPIFQQQFHLVYGLPYARVTASARSVQGDTSAYRCSGVKDAPICSICPYLENGKPKESTNAGGLKSSRHTIKNSDSR